MRVSDVIMKTRFSAGFPRMLRETVILEVESSMMEPEKVSSYFGSVFELSGFDNSCAGTGRVSQAPARIRDVRRPSRTLES